MITYIVAVLDTHPAAIANGNKIVRTKLGESGPNYFPFFDRQDAETYANHMNRNRPDDNVHAYVEAVN